MPFIFELKFNTPTYFEMSRIFNRLRRKQNWCTLVINNCIYKNHYLRFWNWILDLDMPKDKESSFGFIQSLLYSFLCSKVYYCSIHLRCRQKWAFRIFGSSLRLLFWCIYVCIAAEKIFELSWCFFLLNSLRPKFNFNSTIN